MSRFMFFLCLLNLCTPTAGAVGWDARTTRTNTAVSDGDIQQALNNGLTPAFTQAFPDSQFGIHVMVDRHQKSEFPQDLVYLGLGLSKRLPDGGYTLAQGYVTDILALPKGATDSQQRLSVTQRLRELASHFSQMMLRYKSSRGDAAAPAPSSSHWSEWPDYTRGSPSKR
jgi:hypothetical protein